MAAQKESDNFDLAQFMKNTLKDGNSIIFEPGTNGKYNTYVITGRASDTFNLKVQTPGDKDGKRQKRRS